MDAHLEPLRPRVAQEGPRILLVARSHGEPRNRARLARMGELSALFSAAGAKVDLVTVVDAALEPYEEVELEGLRRWVRRLHLVPHPRLDSAWARFRDRIGDCFGRTLLARPPERAPWALSRFLRARARPKGYHAVVALGLSVAPVLSIFPPWTRKLIDLARLGSVEREECLQVGLVSAARRLPRVGREQRLIRGADLVVVTSTSDAVTLRAHGYRGDIVPTPHLGLFPWASDSLRPVPYASSSEPARPARILFVGSDTPANLDAVAWFRREVLSLVADAVPAVRLRIVGDVCRSIAQAPDIERMGRVADLEEEYRSAAAVVLPLRAGGGLRRRAVEALRRGKVLAATSVGARGLELAGTEEAIVADDPAKLALGLAKSLLDDGQRGRMEAKALEAARRLFDPVAATAGLVEWMGLPLSRTAFPEARTRRGASLEVTHV